MGPVLSSHAVRSGAGRANETRVGEPSRVGGHSGDCNRKSGDGPRNTIALPVFNPRLARRDLLRVLAIGAATATTSARASTDAEDFPDKRKAHYQADSPEVQTFYRVNRYPPS